MKLLSQVPTRSRWPHFQRSKAVRSCRLRYRPRSRSRWPHFQRSKAVHSEFLNEVVVSGPDPFTLALLSTI